MRAKTISLLRQAWRRAVRSPKSTAAGVAALVALVAPHYDSARLLAVVVFVLGLVSEDSRSETTE